MEYLIQAPYSMCEAFLLKIRWFWRFLMPIHISIVNPNRREMKTTIRIIISFFILFFIVSSTSVAEELSYTCKVTHVYELGNDGSLRISNWEKQFKDSEFSVSRATGEIVGELVPTLLARSTKIVNKGSKEFSFKSIADFGDQVQLIEIQEFAQQMKKPFVAVAMGGAGIVTGLCK